MREEYDFKTGERGKFYQTNAKMNYPVYLEEAVQEYLAAKAHAKGVELNVLVNDMLKKDIDLAEGVK